MWCRPATVALIGSLALELPYAASVALKRHTHTHTHTKSKVLTPAWDGNNYTKLEGFLETLVDHEDGDLGP